MLDQKRTSLKQCLFVLRTPKDDAVLKMGHGLASAGDMEASVALWFEATDRGTLFLAQRAFLSIEEKQLDPYLVSKHRRKYTYICLTTVRPRRMAIETLYHVPSLP